MADPSHMDALYERLIVPLTRAQEAIATNMRAIAARRRTQALLRQDRIRAMEQLVAAIGQLIATERAMAHEDEAVAMAADALAESIPSAAQAAADLGTAAERHDLRHLTTAAEAARVLAAQVDDDNREAQAAMVDLRGVVEQLRRDIAADRADVLRQRTENNAQFATIAATLARIEGAVNGGKEHR